MAPYPERTGLAYVVYAHLTTMAENENDKPAQFESSGAGLLEEGGLSTVARGLHREDRAGLGLGQ